MTRLYNKNKIKQNNNMIKEIIIPKEVDFIINELKDKRVKSRLMKVYNALVYKKGVTKGYFDVPSNYLKKVSSRYSKAIDTLIEYGVIDYKKTVEFSFETIFDDKKKVKKKYNADRGQCMKYKFLIDTTEGKSVEVDIDVDDIYKGNRWYNLTKKSLIELGLKPRIGRDNFSRRLHTNVTGTLGLKSDDDTADINSYKDYCKGYYTIDGVTSQPRLVWLWLEEMGVYDEKFYNIFESDVDFYEYLMDNIYNITTRDMGKMLFLEWINGKGYSKEGKDGDDIRMMNKLFPIITTIIKSYKKDDYKDFCKMLQHRESKIWIDDLLENCPTDFGLTIHDSLIVKEEDADKVLEYCKTKYPRLKFKKEMI
jgi:hypothetical protein